MPGRRLPVPNPKLSDMVSTPLEKNRITFLNWLAELDGTVLMGEFERERHLAELHPRDG